MRIKKEFNNELKKLEEIISDDKGDWTIKGFIDLKKNIYTITTDTKVLSKVLEIVIFPHILSFAQNNNYKVQLTPYQNYYPDITLIDNSNNEKYAIDMKTTYRKDTQEVNGMTLGAFTGYFRERDSKKNILYPYNEYKEHFVLGVIYSRTDFAKTIQLLREDNVNITKNICKLIVSYLSNPDEENWRKIVKVSKNIDSHRSVIDSYLKKESEKYDLNNFHNIQSVARDFQFFFVEKWKIATTRPGSGNTKNIGGISDIQKLIDGLGPFTEEEDGKKVFDDYWMHYETLDMAKANGREKPLFNNIETYTQWRNR